MFHGKCFDCGLGVEVDMVEAARRYKLSADQWRTLFEGDPNRSVEFARGASLSLQEVTRICRQFSNEVPDEAQRCYARCVAQISDRSSD
jgi:hypothetical protein